MTSFIFFPVNGSGMGHLTRCLAYARRLRERAECIFFSLSSAMEVVEEMGLTGDYFVSPFWSANTTYDWNCELAVRFGMLLERTRPDVVVFDGTWPFQGFLAACRAYGRPLKLVWSNRGLLKKDAKTVPVDKSLFDLLIRPGELGSTPGEERTPEGVRQLHVPPVLLLDDDDILSRAAAREQLGLRPGGPYALFSLGPGNLKDVSGPGLRLVREVQMPVLPWSGPARPFPCGIWNCPPRCSACPSIRWHAICGHLICLWGQRATIPAARWRRRRSPV